MGLREIKQFAQKAGGTQIQSQADGSDGRVQFFTITACCWRQRNYARAYKSYPHRKQMTGWKEVSVKMSDRFTNIPYVIPTQNKEL